MINKKNLSLVLKFLVFICAFCGTVSACIFAEGDGYSPWTTRLMYFTHQSNVWIAVTCLAIAILVLCGKNVPDWLYKARYVFVVSISLTGVIFCGLLAPFANYNVWQYYSILNHVVVPVLAVADFCIDKYAVVLVKKQRWLAFLPPLAYFAFATPLSLLKVNFGMGQTYPYYFFNFYSEAGLFGFVDGNPAQLGSIYWFVLIFIIIWCFACLYFAINKQKTKTK